MSQFKIPLSFTPFNPDGIKEVLLRYSDGPQMQLVHDFEKEIVKFTGSKYAVALSSGTAGIHLALKAEGVGPGDEVLVSAFTYVASVNPILYLGAIPIFIDSEETTWNMDPSLLLKAIKERLDKGRKPKAILVVHAYGMPAWMTDIMSLSREFDIPVIEDAAEALGSEFGKMKVGTLGHSGIFSFNNNKIITTFGGGALVTNDEKLYQNALLWASQSRENKPYYEHKEIGFNYRMGPLTAAQGISEFTSVKLKIEQRRAVFSKYQSLLNRISEIGWLKEPEGSFSNRWLTAILLPENSLEKIQRICSAEGIETRPLWNPMNEQPVFQHFTAFKCGVSSSLFKRGLTLPSSSWLSEPDQEKISSVLSAGFGYGGH